MFGKKNNKKPEPQTQAEDQNGEEKLSLASQMKSLFVGKQKESDQRALVGELLNVGKNFLVKARTPNAFIMATVQMYPAYLSGHYHTVAEMFGLDQEEPEHNSFCNLYAIDSMALGGAARAEARDTLIGIGADIVDNLEAKRKDKLKEGNR